MSEIKTFDIPPGIGEELKRLHDLIRDEEATCAAYEWAIARVEDIYRVILCAPIYISTESGVIVD